MPIHYEIQPDQKVVYTTLKGELSEIELADYFMSLVSHPLFHPSFRVLVNTARIDSVAVTGEEIRAMSEATHDEAAKLGGARVAIYAPSDVVYGMMRMYQTLRDESPYDIKVFRDLGEARRWLGLSAA